MIPRLKADLGISDLTALWPSRDNKLDVEKFERAFAELANQKYAISFPYGRTAQIAILNALGKPGGEVICPSYTCVVVAHAIVKAGMKPVFIDSNQSNFNMDWSYVREATNSKTIAIIATSIFGHPVNGDEFKAYRKDFPSITILQDCAHSFLANDSHKEGLAAFFGLNISKIITSIFGGMVTTDDQKFAVKVRKEREDMLVDGGITHEIKKSLYLATVIASFTHPIYRVVNFLERKKLLNRFVKYYDPYIIDLPKDAFISMGGVQSRIGLMQCERYHKIVEHRRMIAEIYHTNLKGLFDFIMPPKHRNMTVSHFVIRTKYAERIKNECLNKNIQVGELIDYDCSEIPIYKKAKYYGKKKSKEFPRLVINLPVHKGISELDAHKICTLLRNIANQI